MKPTVRLGLRILVVGFCLSISVIPAWGQEAKKSSPAALSVYADAANFQNNGALDLAVEEWAKFLKKFPDDPLAPKAQHYLGVCNLQLKKLDKAAEAFELVVTKHAKFELAEEALLNLGWCRHTLAGQGDKELYPKAAEAFTKLIADFPKGKYVDQAWFFKGEALYAMGKKPEAIECYAAFVEEHPKSNLRADGVYALGVTHEEVSQFPDAAKAYDLFLKEFADHELATEVKMRKAETVLQAGEFADAEKQFAAVAREKDFASADHARFRQAYCVSKQERFEDAAKLYVSIISDYKDSSYQGDAQLYAGRCYYRAQNFKEAATWFDKVLTTDSPAAPEAAHWRCRIHLQDKEPQKAIALAEKMVPKATDSSYLVNLKMDEADGLYEIAESRPQALAKYLQLATDHADDPQAPQALYNAAFTALEIKQYDAALTHSGAFIKTYADHTLLPDAQYVAAEVHLQQSRHEPAEQLFEQLVSNHPKHPEAEVWQVRLGLTQFLQKKYDAVVKGLQARIEGLKGADNKAESLFLIGASQFHLKEYPAAAGSLSASLTAQPKWRQADETTLFLARAQSAEGKVDEALATIKQLIADFPDSNILDQAHYRLGEFHYAATAYPEANAAYDVVVQKYPQSMYAPYALYGQGWSQFKNKKYAEGAAALGNLIENHADHTLVADARFARAMCNRQAGEFDAVIKDVDEYLKSNPGQPNKSDALYERGLAEVALKQFDVAAKTFDGLLKDQPEYASADKVLYELGWAYKSGDKAAEATAAFEKLATQHSDSPLAAEGYFHVGEHHYTSREYPAAEKAYEQAAQRAKQGELSEKSLYKLGWSQFQQKKYEPALEQFASQVEKHPEGGLKSDALFMKAECLFRMDKFDAAFPAFEAVQADQPASPQMQVLALLHGGQAAAQIKKWKESVEWLAQIPTRFPDSPYVPEAYYEVGWARHNDGDSAAAKKDFEQAVAKSRGTIGARAQFMIGELDFEAKEFADAIRAFQRVMFGYGGEKADDEVKQWQAKAGFEAGRCAEVQIKEAADDAAERRKAVEEATRFYQYVVEKHPKSELVKNAQSRLTELAKLK